jgi:hypothetical protein
MNWLRVTIEQQYTRDHRAPLFEGSSEEHDGWRCIPVPPGPPEEGWEILDSSSDRKTLWFRRVFTAAGRVYVLVFDRLVYLGRWQRGVLHNEK